MEDIVIAAVVVFFLTVVWRAVRTLKGGKERYAGYYAPYDSTSAAAAMKKMPDALKATEFNGEYA